MRIDISLLPVLAAFYQFNFLGRKILAFLLQTGAKTCNFVGPQGDVNFRNFAAGSDLTRNPPPNF